MVEIIIGVGGRYKVDWSQKRQKYSRHQSDKNPTFKEGLIRQYAEWDQKILYPAEATQLAKRCIVIFVPSLAVLANI